MRLNLLPYSDEVSNLCALYGVERLELFGSAARPDFDPADSDLDFLVDFADAHSLGAFDRYFGLKEDLERLYNIFRLLQNPEEWVASLPQAIRIPRPFFSQTNVMDLAKESSKKITGLIPKFSRNLPGFKSTSDSISEKTEQQEEATGPDNSPTIYSGLSDIFKLIETLIENNNRLEIYQLEVETLIDKQITFQEWKELTPGSDDPRMANNLVYISV